MTDVVLSPEQFAGPEIIAQAPGGQVLLLGVNPRISEGWETGVVDTIEVERAVVSVIGQFELVRRRFRAEMADLPTDVQWPSGVKLYPIGSTLSVALWQLGRITGLGNPTVLSMGEMLDDRHLAPIDQTLSDGPLPTAIEQIVSAIQSEGGR